MHDEILFTLRDENEQILFGKKLADSCNNRGAVIYLQGDLGAGKTTLARGFIKALGYSGKIKSPTYTLVEFYELKNIKILHIDLYRINNPEEVYVLGLREQIDSKTICLIEWPEKAMTQLPPPDITCYIEPFEKGRVCRVVSHTRLGQEMTKALC